jgi:hypothetical protein
MKYTSINKQDILKIGTMLLASASLTMVSSCLGSRPPTGMSPNLSPLMNQGHGPGSSQSGEPGEASGPVYTDPEK